jgi:hypothetical protein
MKTTKPVSVHSTYGKNYDKLTKKQHIERELELWGTITLLQLKLKEARKKIRLLKRAH